MFYLDLFAALRRHEVHHVLIGGLAVSLHGIERATMDIDLALDCEPENLGAMVEVAREHDLQPVLPVPLDALADQRLLEEWHRDRNLTAFALRGKDLAGVTIDLADIAHLRRLQQP